jgi:hypothetical protein
LFNNKYIKHPHDLFLFLSYALGNGVFEGNIEIMEWWNIGKRRRQETGEGNNGMMEDWRNGVLG